MQASQDLEKVFGGQALDVKLLVLSKSFGGACSPGTASALVLPTML